MRYIRKIPPPLGFKLAPRRRREMVFSYVLAVAAAGAAGIVAGLLLGML